MGNNDTKLTPTNILNRSYDAGLDVIIVEQIGADGVLKNPATEAKQDELALYKTQTIDDYTTTSVTYFCKMKTDGTWLFMKIDETGNFPTFTYANVSNNATKTTYALAYTDRTTLTYGLLNTLTF